MLNSSNDMDNLCALYRLCDNCEYKNAFDRFFTIACEGNQIARIILSRLVLLCIYDFNSMHDIEVFRNSATPFVINKDYLLLAERWICELPDDEHQKVELMNLLVWRKSCAYGELPSCSP
jgi:hypothetical protein